MAPRFRTCRVPRINDYVRDVLAGRVVVGRLIHCAVERHLDDLARTAAAKTTKLRTAWPYIFDAEEATFAIDFAECLRHSKGEWAGQRLRLAPWQCFLVGSLFGWRHRTTGARRFRTAYVEVARKNGKSTLVAALGHKLFVADNEQGAEVYTAATKLAQARIVHEESKRMARSSPGLKKLVEINRDAIYCQATNSTYRPLGADGGTEDGLNVHGALVDELHAHRSREMWDVLETATGARHQPLLIAITTAGDGNNRQTICWELRSYSQKILDKHHQDPTWFAAVYALDDARYDARGREVAAADDWTDPANWPKANPNLGVSQSLEDLTNKCKKAVETPSAAPNFRRKHLNQWISTLADWLPAGLWEANAGEETWYGPEGLLPEVRERYRDKPCWLAGDLSAVSDLTAVVFAFKNDAGGLDLFPFAWCPRETATEKAASRHAPYLLWEDANQLEITEGNSVDYEAIRHLLRQARDQWRWDVRQIGLDPHNARYLCTLLAEQDHFEVYEHRQGFLSMNDPIKQTTRLLLDKKLRHGNHRPLAWCVSNVVTKSDPAGNLKFDKEKSAEKIDLAVATVMACGMAIAAKDTPSFARTGGIRSL